MSGEDDAAFVAVREQLVACDVPAAAAARAAWLAVRVARGLEDLDDVEEDWDTYLGAAPGAAVFPLTHAASLAGRVDRGEDPNTGARP